MEHWNYRLVQHDDHVAMIEAWYNGRGQLVAWADAGPVIGDDLEDITGELANRAKALDAPIIPITYLEELDEEEVEELDDAEIGAQEAEDQTKLILGSKTYKAFKEGFQEGRSAQAVFTPKADNERPTKVGITTLILYTDYTPTNRWTTMNYNPTQWLDHWFASHDNLVTLTYWLAGNGYDAGAVAHAVEKPWKYEAEFYAAKHDLDELDLLEVMEQYNSMDNEQTIEELMKARADSKEAQS